MDPWIEAVEKVALVLLGIAGHWGAGRRLLGANDNRETNVAAQLKAIGQALEESDERLQVVQRDQAAAEARSKEHDDAVIRELQLTRQTMNEALLRLIDAVSRR